LGKKSKNVSSTGMWLGGVAVVVFLGFVAGRQQQIVDSQREILRQIQAMQSSPGTPTVQAPPQPALPDVPSDFVMNIDGAAIKGRADAKLTLIEFSDFECPFCGRYMSDTYPQLTREYVDTGKVRYVFRHFPLERIHPKALKASEAAECARVQGEFWPMHDRMFADQQSLAESELVGHARTIGLDVPAFQACLNGQATAKVRADLDAGARAGMTGTPTFFIGFEQSDGTVHVVEKLVGAKPFRDFKSVLDRMLASADTR
jgi:protein-disulfide isomerase